MSQPAPIRCTAPHPRRPGLCGARLFDAQPETVEVRVRDDVPPGCVAIECPRCGTRYVACDASSA